MPVCIFTIGGIEMDAAVYEALTKEQLLKKAPSDAPKNLKVNYNKKSKIWYYYLSEISYSPEKKRGVDKRTLVARLSPEGEFCYLDRYLLQQKAFRGAKTDQAKALVKSLRQECAENFEDDRTPFLVIYPLDIVFSVVFLASLGGTTSCLAIADYWKKHRTFLEDLFGDFPKDDISHDTVRRVFMLHDPKQFESLFKKYVEQMLDLYKQRIVSIDGQMVRATKQTAKNRNGRYLMGFYDVVNEMTLGQVLIDEKTNEIPVAQEVLRTMDLTDCVVTGDALHAHKKTVQIILNQNGNYVVGLKGNQGKLQEYVETYFERPGSKVKSNTTKDHGHGRDEVRTIQVLPANLLPMPLKSAWAGLEDGCLIKTVEHRTVNGETSVEERYYISSLSPDDTAVAHRLQHIIRRHWAIENELHYVLDVTMRQDAIQSKQPTYIKNRTLLNKLVQNFHSKYRQVCEKEDDTSTKTPRASKAQIARWFSTPEDAIQGLIKVRSQYA